MEMLKVLEEINNYDDILIYRHVNPDLDAYGSQLGMYEFVKANYAHKNVVLMGDMVENLNKMYYPEGVPVTAASGKKALGIVVDTANKDRIDGDISLADKVIKIDHHLIVDQYGDMNIVVESASSCAEIIALMIGEVLGSYNLPQNGARALYMGIIGDSNRFMYRSTSRSTFEAASILLDQGINIEEIYASMYVRREKDLEVTKYILNNYKNDNGVAYYYLSDDALNELGITRNEGSNYVNTLANIEEFKIWIAVTENKADNNVRVSIRSREHHVNVVANKYNGGGHALASGATLSSIEELPHLIADLQEVINNGQ